MYKAGNLSSLPALYICYTPTHFFALRIFRAIHAATAI